MVYEDIKELYLVGNEENVNEIDLNILHYWAIGLGLNCLTIKNGEDWYVGFDRSLTRLMKDNLLYEKNIILLAPVYSRE